MEPTQDDPMREVDELVEGAGYEVRPNYPLTEAERTEIAKAFTYAPPKDDQPARYVAIREQAKCLAETLYSLCPHSAERTLARRKLEEAVMWANASIARNE